MKFALKIASLSLLASMAFGGSAQAQQEWTCSQDVECQQSKIEAMSQQPQIDIKGLKADVLAMRTLFMQRLMEATEGGEYGGYARGVTAMDDYLARLDAAQKDQAAVSRDELKMIGDDMRNIRAAYFNSSF